MSITDDLTTPPPPNEPPVGPQPGPPPGAAAPLPLTPGRTVWYALGGLVAIVAVGQGALGLLNLLARETTEVPVEVADLDGIERLRIDTDSGSVQLTAGESDEISGRATLRSDLWEPDWSQRVEGDTLVLEADCPWLAMFCGAGVDLAVPADLVVEAATSGGQVTSVDVDGGQELRTSGGAISVTGADGPLLLDTSGGSITVIDGSGDLRADTSGGSIRLEGSSAGVAQVSTSGGTLHLDFTDPPSVVTAHTSGGSITVLVPDDGTAYAVDASTSGGSVSVDVRTDPASRRSIDADTSGGNVTIDYAGR